MTNWKNTFYLYKTISPFAYPLFLSLFLFIFKVSRSKQLTVRNESIAEIFSRGGPWFDQVPTFPFIFRVLYLHSSVHDRLRRRRVRMLAMIYIYRDRVR